MAVLQMQRMSICALKKDRKAILEKIQSMGVMEINHVLDEDEDFRRMDTANARSSFEKAANSADRALEILNEYAPVKTSMLSSLEGKKLVDAKVHEEVIRKREELLKVVSRIQALDKEKAENKAEILKLENRIESLVPWLSLDIPMNATGTKKTSVILGSIPGQADISGIYEILADAAPEVEAADAYVISSGQDMTCIAVICLKQEEQSIEEALRSRGFSRIAQSSAKTPAGETEELKQAIKEKENRISQIEQEVIRLAEQREEIYLLADYYRVRAEKYEVLGEIPQSANTFVLSGYVPHRDVEKVKRVLESKYDCAIDVEELKEEEEPPVLLKNNKFSASAEGVLESFGLPKKGEIDPTAIMSVFYVFLFGLMLSDAAYGAIVSIACGVLILKFPRMSEGMKKSIQLFFWCGLSTLFWGIMFGGYFGDVINVVSRTFFGHEVGIKALWFVPLNNPMKLLIYSMVFGLIHLFTGLGIKGYMCIRDKKYVDFLCDVVLWYVFLIGLILLLIPTDIFASIAQVQITFPPVVNAIAKWASILGAVGIVLMSGRANKNFGLRIALGAYDLYNVTGWLSDVLSYSRLLALGLATGVIAQVVNQMGSMGGKSVFGVILFVIVFIIGHVFNIAINLLGAYVHTNRLQYVEFFGKFYEGGGRAFHPFRENTKYADVKEE